MFSLRDSSIINRLYKRVKNILALAKQFEQLTDEQLQAKTPELRAKIAEGASLDEILEPAYAVAYEAARRKMGFKIFPVQIIGGIVLNQGDVAEMRTGEGKTLTALLPIYLNALSGKGVHVVTVNEYLAQRDADYNRPALEFLGISVGVNLREMRTLQKREAYAKDVTYTTNSELGFDYLRDNMVTRYEDKVQRPLNFAIIDEADSILVDEARTPLIISGGKRHRTPLYKATSAFAKGLTPDDYTVELESKQIALTEPGVAKAQEFFGLKNLFAIENSELFHNILNALKATYLFEKNVEYVVKEDKIILVDQFTGRLMPGRAYSDGLQQALQAKEHVKVEEETTTFATITYQNFFRLYARLSGMTGTAKTEEEEFLKIYNMRVVVVPTNKPMIRVDHPDFVFANQEAKFKALLKAIKKYHENHQPILVGTASVEVSEIIHQLLLKEGISHEVLNAKNNEREAEIIARAGEKDAVTIATNMAGRGTDIKLGEGVAQIGGLVVLGTERHEARRIDNQLRGRSGRQGDIGLSRFYVSIDDQLMLRFGSKRLEKVFGGLGDDSIQSRMLTRAITSAQKKVEGLNFDQRKNLLDYDNVLAQQREVMYKRRDEILKTTDFTAILQKMALVLAQELLHRYERSEGKDITVDYKRLLDEIEERFVLPGKLKVEELQPLSLGEAAKMVARAIWATYQEKTADYTPDVHLSLERPIVLQAFDLYWTQHIDDSTRLRTGIYLRSYAQINPLQAYVEESEKLFIRMQINIAEKSWLDLMGATTAAFDVEHINDAVRDAIERTRREEKIGG